PRVPPLRSFASEDRPRRIRRAGPARRGSAGPGDGVAARRSHRDPRLRRPPGVLPRGGRRRQGGPRRPILDLGTLDELARGLAGQRVPARRCRLRDHRGAASGTTGAASRHQLAEARAEPHRDRLRVASGRGGQHRVPGVGSQQSRLARYHDLRPGCPALLGDEALRHRGRTDQGLPDVLLALAMSAEPVRLVAAGAVTPFGADLDAFWSGLITGSDGISMIERFPVDDLRVGRGGEIKKFRPLPGPRRVACRAPHLLLAAAEDLLARAPISAEPERVAVVLGTALGGVGELERALAPGGRPRQVMGALYDSPAHALARRLGARGPVIT